jgi:hypothetical protein
MAKRAAVKKTAARKNAARTTAARKTAAKKTAAKKTAEKRTTARKTTGRTIGGRKKAAKRELIDTGTSKRFVRRGAGGKFKHVVEVGKSLAADRRSKAKTKVKSGQGDKGDR